MERSDNKRRGARYCEGRLPSRPRPDDEVAPPAVNDDEVEEFFTILRQIGDASRRIATGQRTVVASEGSTLWNPEFSLEDFAAGPEAVKSDGSSTSPSVPAAEEQRAEIVARRRLDLNMEPEPEG